MESNAKICCIPLTKIKRMLRLFQSKLLKQIFLYEWMYSDYKNYIIKIEYYEYEM